MDNEGFLFNCGCALIWLIFSFLIGAWSVNYLLLEFLNKTIPVLGAGLIAFFVGEFTIPVAIVVWLLHLFRVL